MKSRITIDVDEDNQPIIKIEYNESEDVRDKLVKRFMEKFGGSWLANFHYHNWSPSQDVNRICSITPVPYYQLEIQSSLIDLSLNEVVPATSDMARTKPKYNGDSKPIKGF